MENAETTALIQTAEALEVSGMTRKYRFIGNAVRHFIQTGNPTLLIEAQKKHPGIFNKARAIANSGNPFLPVPDGDELASLEGSLKIGMVNEKGFTAGMEPVDFTFGLVILGKIGGGKSYAGLRLIAQLISIPKDQRDFNLLIIQGQKRDSDFLIRTNPYLRIIKKDHFRRAPLFVEDWDTKQEKIDSFCPIFAASHWLLSLSQPMFQQSVQLAFDKLDRENKRGAPTFSDIFDQIPLAVSELKLSGYDSKNTADKIRSVLNPFIRSKEIYNGTTGLKTCDFFSKEDCILNLKGEASDYVLSTIVTDILIDLQRYYEKKPLSERKLRTLVVIDESRRIFHVKESLTDHNPYVYMERFVTTRRSSGIGLIAITQEPQSMPKWLSDTASYAIGFPITGESRNKLQKILNLTDEQAAYFDTLPKEGTGVMRYPGFPRRFIIDIPSDIEAFDMPENETDAIMQPYITELHEKLKKEAEEWQKDSSAKKAKEQAEPVTMSKETIDALTILNALDRNPFIYKTALRKRYLNDDSERMGRTAQWLIRHGYANEIQGVTPDGGKASYFTLTQKAHNTLKTPSKRRVSELRFLHTMYCERIANWLKKAGRKPEREHLTPYGLIDVFVQHGKKQTAYEMEHTISRTQAETNIRKCLNSGIDEIFLVVEGSRGDLDSLRAILADLDISPDDLEKVSYTTIKGLKSIILGKEDEPEE